MNDRGRDWKMELRNSNGARSERRARERDFRAGEKLTGLGAYASRDRWLGCKRAKLDEAR